MEPIGIHNEFLDAYGLHNELLAVGSQILFLDSIEKIIVYLLHR